MIKDKNISMKWKVLFIFLISVIYFGRLLYIDSDISAPWGVLTYQPIDEGAYGELALNMQNFGTINPNEYYGGKYEYYMGPQVINNLIGNAFSYVPMLIFGDNYLGFRMGPIVAGYIVILFFFLILLELRNKYRVKIDLKYKIILLLLSVYVLFNFVFYNACRIVEPTIYRLLFLQIITYVFVKEKINDKLRFFLVGFLTTISIFLVYITNAFICIALFLAFLFMLLWKENKKARDFFVFALLGVVIGYLISWIYYYSFWNVSPIKNLFDSIFLFKDVSGYSSEGVTYFLNIRALGSSNIMLYNPLILCLFIAAVPFCLKTIFEKKDVDILFILSLVISFLLQTMFSEDYAVRKSLIIFFTMLYIIYIFCISGDNIEKLFSSKYSIITIFILAFVVIYNMVYRTYWIDNGTELDFSFKDKILVYSAALTAIMVMIFLFFVKNGKLKKIILYIGIIITCLVNVLFVTKYNILNRTYSEKEIMIELGKHADGKIICLSFDFCITLYNDVLPLTCDESKMVKYMKKNPNMYYYGFSDFESFNKNPKSINQHVKPVVHFKNRKFKTFGVKRNFTLYKYKK